MPFDRYITVDWSARSKPKTGKDTVWICTLAANGVSTTENPRTRRDAEAVIRDALREALGARERVLVGFDFPYSYPAGFAGALGLDGTAWEAIWKYLAEHIDDDEKNRNNRFQVASGINAQLSQRAFWGCPHKKVFEHLLPKKAGVVYKMDGEDRGLAEWREVEAILHTRKRHPQSVWKLNGSGSVGGQSLTGIPVLYRVRHDSVLAPVSRVWPFEVTEPTLPEGLPAVVHAEIWPSLMTVPEVEGQVKDESQVIFLAEEYRRRDRVGTLASLFAAASTPAALEEGWILGVE
jgi:precorrin-8X/cobalt-precorrin-8 methylmutase